MIIYIYVFIIYYFFNLIFKCFIILFTKRKQWRNFFNNKFLFPTKKNNYLYINNKNSKDVKIDRNNKKNKKLINGLF